MIIEPLSEIADIVMGQSPPSSTYNHAKDGLPFFQGKADFGDRQPSIRIFCSQPTKIAERGDILISVRAPVGPANIAPSRCCIGRGLAAIRAKRIDPTFLWHFFRHHESQLTARGKGSTFEAINRDDLEKVRVPIPSILEQKRVVGILEKADRLRRISRYADQLSDTFLQSVFLKMFGKDFEQNGPKIRFGELVKITGGGTPARNVPAYFTGRIPWLTAKDMRGDYIFDTQEHITEEAIANSATNLVPAGSILVVVKSKVLMHRLPLAISKVPLCHGQDIKSIQCSDSLEPEFGRFILKRYEPHLLRIARGANTEGLTLPMLQELLVPDISKGEQQKFVAIVRRFEGMRAQQREAERQAEHLFQTLLDRAFSLEQKF